MLNHINSIAKWAAMHAGMKGGDNSNMVTLGGSNVATFRQGAQGTGMYIGSAIAYWHLDDNRYTTLAG